MDLIPVKTTRLFKTWRNYFLYLIALHTILLLAGNGTYWQINQTALTKLALGVFLILIPLAYIAIYATCYIAVNVAYELGYEKIGINIRTIYRLLFLALPLYLASVAYATLIPINIAKSDLARTVALSVGLTRSGFGVISAYLPYAQWIIPLINMILVMWLFQVLLQRFTQGICDARSKKS